MQKYRHGPRRKLRLIEFGRLQIEHSGKTDKDAPKDPGPENTVPRDDSSEVVPQAIDGPQHPIVPDRTQLRQRVAT